ncbi:MAG TPA: M15 family metallopeptidase [Pyrinomonadaceae bacterium]|nr:M15 family metallopeptidase [Pyrinomonadaceae bacterium]
MKTKSYIGKEFIVINNDTRLRQPDNLNEWVRYKAGDAIPVGKSVGDIVTIPKRTPVNVTDTRIGNSKAVIVFARPIEGGAPAGWTLGTNLDGGLVNETIGLSPARWDAEPDASTRTCTDQEALIRGGAPDFAPAGGVIPFKSYCVVSETSSDGKFVKVRRAEASGGNVTLGDELGWTRASNLSGGCSDIYFSSDWLNTKGPNACWRLGEFIGSKVLVNIVGRGGEVEQITLDSLDAYLKLKDAALEDRITLAIESAFRTYGHQAFLYDLHINHGGNKAAKPGRSDHQHGQAFDLNTHRNKFDGDPIYDWLKTNGPGLGFIRTVSGEPWHWEYLPAEAAQLKAQGKFKRGDVSP